MNKNLKRALNTTAAVSMSLAMVLGAAAPVMAETSYDKVDISKCDNDVVEGYEKLIKKLDDAGLSIDSMKLDDVLDVDTATANDTVGNAATVSQLLTATVNGDSILGEMLDCLNVKSDEYATVKKLANFVLGVANAEAAVTTLESRTGENGPYSDPDAAGVDETTIRAAREYYNDITDASSDLQVYMGNMSESKIDAYNDAIVILEEFIGVGSDNWYDQDVEDYVNALETIRLNVVDGTTIITVKTLMDGDIEDGQLPASKLKEVKKILENIQEDKNTTLKSIAKYEDIADEADVADIIAALESLVENMEAAAELQDKKLDETVAYNKKTAYLNDVKVSPKEVVEAMDTDSEIDDEEFDDVLKVTKTNTLDTIVEYYDAVVSKFYEVEIKERANGTFRAVWTPTELALHLNNTALFDEFKNLAVVVDSEEETTYLDELMTRSANITADIEAITTGLKGITVKNMTAKDVKAIQAAEDAMIRLAGGVDVTNNVFAEEGAYTGNLTTAQKKEISGAYRNVKALVDRMYEGGFVNAIVGWVETAQGWEYYDNNGNRVMEGWAAGNGYWSFMKNGYSVSNEWCAAKDGWYYMGADGKMVTGIVTIDGVEYNFGTDGIWVR